MKQLNTIKITDQWTYEIRYLHKEADMPGTRGIRRKLTTHIVRALADIKPEVNPDTFKTLCRQAQRLKFKDQVEAWERRKEYEKNRKKRNSKTEQELSK